MNSFYLHCPWCWAPFRICIAYLDVLFCEVLVQVFCLLYIGLFS